MITIVTKYTQLSEKIAKDAQYSFLKGVSAKTSPNDYFTSKKALHSYEVIIFVSNSKANIPREK